MKTIYDYTAKSLQGKEVTLNEFKGKVVVIVNTASKCGFTPQYEGLEKLYQKYKDKGLVVLGFPCNQFGNQEPGSAKDIQEGCLINYGVSFRMFEKIDVNGDQEHALYSFLKKEQKGLLNSKIKWNFTKFLIDRDGKPVKRFAPITKPEKMEEDILQLL
ncbi:glutathione peroxidase [Mangrovibacterium lignilyticum]|uniref:glutathione peroxidase n=1 Tax=Mangrovibacterium lignilyticum TaxID=2668052 RepID=UPI0013D15E9C|nr:glutathione peroxidase [Mangrovibacterium lignilyticum]